MLPRDWPGHIPGTKGPEGGIQGLGDQFWKWGLHPALLGRPFPSPKGNSCTPGPGQCWAPAFPCSFSLQSCPFGSQMFPVPLADPNQPRAPRVLENPNLGAALQVQGRGWETEDGKDIPKHRKELKSSFPTGPAPSCSQLGRVSAGLSLEPGACRTLGKSPWKKPFPGRGTKCSVLRAAPLLGWEQEQGSRCLG